MLTVDYDRLGVGPGDRVLDLGLRVRAPRVRGGPPRRLGGRARRRPRRGGPGARHVRRHGRGGRAGRRTIPPTAVQGDALALPFADGTFDRVIASEVLEHIPDDAAAMRELARVLRPGGAMAVTVPRCVPEAINWALSDEYHDTPGRPRAHLPALDAGAPARARPGSSPRATTTPTACTRPTGGCAASSVRPTTRTRPSRRTTRSWSGTSSRPRS